MEKLKQEVESAKGIYDLLVQASNGEGLSLDDKDKLEELLGNLHTSISISNDVEIELTEFDKHEALHAASIALDVFAGQVEDHAFVRQTPELAELAQKATEAIYAVYNKIGEIHLDNKGVVK